MSFQSILFLHPPGQIVDEQPEFFSDLNLDQVVQALTARREEYDLKPFFYTPLHTADEVYYRHEVLQDLEDKPLLNHIRDFADGMVQVRRFLKMLEKLDFAYHKKGWLLEAALLYCETVLALEKRLQNEPVTSRGFLAFRQYLTAYCQSAAFESLFAEAQQVKAQLAAIQYSIIIQTGRFSVKRYEGEPDYTPQVERTFARFRQGAVKNYLADLPEATGMNHIEAQILDFVSRLYPEPFAALDQFCESHAGFLDDTLTTFDREVQFYLAWLDFAADLKRQGKPFCYPIVDTSESGTLFARQTFDLALAYALLFTDKTLVYNDFHLNAPERVIVVTGPNQGGKTTFARMFGQLHFLAALGLPVPGLEARLPLPDRVFTHFEKVEDIRNLRGKLQDDLMRIHGILSQATSQSILVLNEIFSSTTLQDAVFLSQEVMKRVSDLNALCVWVTFIDELASFNEKTVSMVSTVSEENPAERTFRIVRRAADGLAYALSLAEKHGLTYARLKERIRA